MGRRRGQRGGSVSALNTRPRINHMGRYHSERVIRRFLLARQLDVGLAFEFWSKWVVWRQEHRPELITRAQIQPQLDVQVINVRGRCVCMWWGWSDAFDCSAHPHGVATHLVRRLDRRDTQPTNEHRSRAGTSAATRAS